MNIDVQRNNLCINQIINQKTENLIIEGDVIIPDIKPDILNVLNTDGNVCIYKKEILDGKIRLDGSIYSNIMYLADDNDSSIRGFSTNNDFSKIIELENVKSDMNMECEVNIKNIESKVINGRKINVKCILEVKMKVSINNNIEFVENINNINDVQKLNKKVNMNSLLGRGETRCFAKDTIIIDNIDNLAEIMKTNINIINREIKVSYNKVLAKADLEIRIMYLTEDNRINCVETKIPVMGFIDIQNVSENDMCEAKYSLKNLIIKPNNVEEHSIYIEAEIEIFCDVYENKKIDLIEDLYSPSVNLNTNCVKVTTIQEKKILTDICNIRQKQNIAEIRNEKIYDVDISINIQNQNVVNGRVIFEGELDLNFLFSSVKTGGINSKKISVPFAHNIEIDGVTKDSKINNNVEVIMHDFVVMPDDSIDVRIDLGFYLDIFKNIDISVINNIDFSEEKKEETYSVIIYFVKSGDTLWKIAKKFKSTVDDIVKMNEIQDENNINVGDELFIPKYNGIIVEENG